MINNSSFDDQVKKQFADYQPEVPHHIWENITAKKDKKRPAAFLFTIKGRRLAILLGILLVAGTAAILISKQNKTIINRVHAPSLTVATISEDGTSKSLIVKNEIPTNISSLLADSLNSNQNTNSTPYIGIRNPSIRVDKTLRTDGNSISKSVSSKFIDIDANITSHSKSVKNQQTKAKSIAANAVRSNHYAQSPNEGNEFHDKNLQTSSSISSRIKLKGKSSALTNRAELENEENNTAVEPSRSLINSGENFYVQKQFLNPELLNTNKIFNFSVKTIQINGLNIPCPGSQKNGAAGKSYLEIYGGPDYAFRSFNDTANSAYLQKRKESTSFTSAFSAGLRYTKVFNNALSFRTGINFSQVNETFKFVDGQVVQLVYTIDNNGDTTGNYAATSNRYKRTQNRYRTIDIPIVIGYEMGNKRLHANINAGIILNAYSWQKGDVLDNSYQPVSITTGKANSPYQFKTNVGLGFTGAVSLYYKLSNHLHFLAEPYFRYNFSAANKADITLKQKFTTTGIRLGLRFDF